MSPHRSSATQPPFCPSTHSDLLVPIPSGLPGLRHFRSVVLSTSPIRLAPMPYVVLWGQNLSGFWLPVPFVMQPKTPKDSRSCVQRGTRGPRVSPGLPLSAYLKVNIFASERQACNYLKINELQL